MEEVIVQDQNNSVGRKLPAEARLRLGLEVGQEKTLTRQMQVVDEVLREQADALRELARR